MKKKNILLFLLGLLCMGVGYFAVISIETLNYHICVPFPFIVNLALGLLISVGGACIIIASIDEKKRELAREKHTVWTRDI